jgi:periplasmic divalent cation tolerance protein
MMQAVLVLTTEADATTAETLARLLLLEGLAGCISLRPVLSLYPWEGKLQRSEEVQLMIKTMPDRVNRLRERLLELHSYDLPQWLQWEAAASPAFGAWLDQAARVTGEN